MRKIRFAVLNTAPMHDYLAPILKQFQDECVFQEYIISSQKEASACVQEHRNQVDVFLVNGLVTAAQLRVEFPAEAHRITDFTMDLLSYHQALLKLLIQNRTLRLSRVFVDFLDPDEEHNLELLITQDTLCQAGQDYLNWITHLPLEELRQLRESLVKRIVSAWSQGKIDYVVTRFSTILPDLEQRNIPYQLVYPAPEYVSGVVRGAIDTAKLSILTHNLPAVILISFGTKDIPRAQEEEKLRRLALQKAVMEYSKDHCYDFLVQESLRGVEVITNTRVIQQMTCSFALCPLKSELEKQLGFEICVGYGLSNELTQARINAGKAEREAALSVQRLSFLMNEQGELIGPLTEGTPLVLKTLPDETLARQAKHAGISPLTLQKIQSVLDALGTDHLTAQQLAERMGITIRSANRFLTKLEAAGMAQVSQALYTKSRGRPERSYHIKIEAP